MLHNTQTDNVIRDLFAKLKLIFEASNEKIDEQEPPELELDHEDRIVKYGGIVAKLSPLLWFLLVALINSPDGALDFVDSCTGDGPQCPWRKGAKTSEGAKRSAASRLSIRLWEKGIPFKIIYHQTTNSFELVLLGLDEQVNRVVCVTSHIFLAIDTANKLLSLIDILIFLLPVLQKIAHHELDEVPIKSRMS